MNRTLLLCTSLTPPYWLYFIDILSVLIQILSLRENRTAQVVRVDKYQFTLPTKEMYTSSIEARRWPTLIWQFLVCPRYVKYPLLNNTSADCCLVRSAPRWLSGDGGEIWLTCTCCSSSPLRNGETGFRAIHCYV